MTVFPTPPKPSVLFICGSRNQTTQMHQIAQHLPDTEQRFTPYYSDGFLREASKLGLIEFSIMGKKMQARCIEYLSAQRLPLDMEGRERKYDLVLTCADIVVPRNIRNSKIVLVQEGMTDPEELMFHLVKRFSFLPRWMASTSVMGLSHAYAKFCVASEGYKTLFIRKGVSPEKLTVTGIPNFDNCAAYAENDFPHRHFVLVCTSDTRETFKYENRRATIMNALRIANGRQLIFRIHPNENVIRAEREVRQCATDALVYTSGNTEQMIANCDVLITKFSSTAFVGLALGKEVHSAFDLNELRSLLPLQNNQAAFNIARVCRSLIRPDWKGVPLTAEELALLAQRPEEAIAA